MELLGFFVLLLLGGIFILWLTRRGTESRHGWRRDGSATDQPHPRDPTIGSEVVGSHGPQRHGPGNFGSGAGLGGGSGSGT